MNGYFAQLAQHSGLNFEPGEKTRANGYYAASKSQAPQEGISGVAPMHVEELTFSASPAPAALLGSNQAPGGPLVEKDRTSGEAGVLPRPQMEPRGPAGTPRAPAMPKTSMKVSHEPPFEETRLLVSDSDSGLREARYLGEQSLAGEHREAQFSEPAAGSQAEVWSQGLNHESRNAFGTPSNEPWSEPDANNRELSARETASSALEERIEPFLGSSARTSNAEPGHAAPDGRMGSLPSLSRRISDAEPGVPSPDWRMEREAIIHNYLKEVRAWVAETPEIDQRELDRPLEAERPARNRDLLAREHQAEAPPLPQRHRPVEPEVQDLNLSIGTISIVIEEPRQNAATLPTAPSRVESPHEHTTGEPTRLSRYYLRSW